MKKLLKVLNPFIYLINVFMFLAYLEGQRNHKEITKNMKNMISLKI